MTSYEHHRLDQCEAVIFKSCEHLSKLSIADWELVKRLGVDSPLFASNPDIWKVLVEMVEERRGK